MAKRTVKQCVAQARDILQDVVTPYRYSESELVDYFNNGQYELKRLRPDAYLGNYGNDLTLYTEATYDVEIPFASIFYQPMVMYISGYAELRDDEFTVEQRAGILLRAFASSLTMPRMGVV